MINSLRFIGIILVLAIATMLVLAVGGVLSSTALWHNVAKIVELAAILFVTTVGIMLLAKIKD